LRIGILELLAETWTTSWAQATGYYLTRKQYASIMPQAIAVWCRQMGHEVHYNTWYGVGDPKSKLPNNLDVVFIAAYTQVSPLAYALARLYAKEKTLTVLGGPHAKSFPHDALRFFDLVVTQCDKAVIADILLGAYPKRTIIASDRMLTDLPTVEERLPEVKTSAFMRGERRYLSTAVPLLSSVGCPYTCNFCTDWNNPYALLPLELLEKDLAFLTKHYPGVMVSFHDPNFAVKFDQTLNVLEAQPPGPRHPYIMESSLSVLRGPRLQRLKDTRCVYVAPGIESWADYSNKAGVGRITGAEKLRRVTDHITELHEYVPGIQANLIFGLDSDAGDEPVELTKQFLTDTPFAWPVINIPVPFGGTPLFDDHLKNGRMLKGMPFAFYYAPYLVTTLKNYEPVDYYAKLIEICKHLSTRQLLVRRLRTTPNAGLRILHLVRTFAMRSRIRGYRQVHAMLTADPKVRAYHEGTSETMPEFYHREYEHMLGPYATLISRADRTPELVPSPAPTPAAMAKLVQVEKA
jgi:radical SAM superfamily enzyme YgiQ (UPF0313 family)